MSNDINASDCTYTYLLAISSFAYQPTDDVPARLE